LRTKPTVLSKTIIGLIWFCQKNEKIHHIYFRYPFSCSIFCEYHYGMNPIFVRFEIVDFVSLTIEIQNMDNVVFAGDLENERNETLYVRL
jgi:hypothetical protein